MSENSFKPETRVKITLPYKDPETASSIRQATMPDNQESPFGVTLKTITEGATLEITIKADAIITLIATLDDLLSCIQAAEKALHEID